jgi:hypothetical protein
VPPRKLVGELLPGDGGGALASVRGRQVECQALGLRAAPIGRERLPQTITVVKDGVNAQIEAVAAAGHKARISARSG